MHDFLLITKALADESRIRILMLLHKGELCVCQIIELLGLAPSTVSKHLFILKQARLVGCRKSGRWIYYRLMDENASPTVREALRWMGDALEKDKRIKEDTQRLKSILKMDPEELCRRQCQS